MSRRRALLVLAALVLAAAGGATAWWYWRDRPPQDHLALQGNVEVRQVNLGFKVAGRIDRVSVDEGDTIRAGQVLASLEKVYFEDEVRAARARVDAQAAAVRRLENGSRPEEIEQAHAATDERRATLENARDVFRRQSELLQRGNTPRQAYDNALAAMREAEAQLASAQANQRLIEAGPRQEDIAQARAQLEAERTALVQAERRLADADLVAPSDGIVQSRVREAGAIVNAGESVYVLSLTTPVWIRSYVSEMDLGRLRPGATVEVRTDMPGGRSYKGQIGFVSPTAEFTPKTVETRELRTALVYRLRIVVDDPDGALRQGMPVTVTVPLVAEGAS